MIRHTQRRSERTLQLALFLTSVVWFLASDTVAAHAARGLAERFSLAGASAPRPLSSCSFCSLSASPSCRPSPGSRSSLREVLGLPKRPTAPRMDARRRPRLGTRRPRRSAHGAGRHTPHPALDSPRAFSLLLLNLVTLAVAALAEEVAFRGYAFRRLIDAIGPVTATIFMSLLFGLAHMLNPDATWTSTIITMLAGLLLSVAWLRTHGLWLGWGLHFAWNASMGILFGLPVSGITDFSTVVETRAFGRLWLTGGDYGPEGALSPIVLLIGIAILVRVTRDYAWNYTHVPIVPGGYPMEAPHRPPTSRWSNRPGQPRSGRSSRSSRPPRKPGPSRMTRNSELA